MPFINPDVGEGGGTSGGGPDDPTRGGRVFTRSQGFLMIAFGIALGLTFMIMFGVLHRFPSIIEKFSGMQEFVTELQPNIWLSFVVGFVGGTILSGIYNILVVRRLNLLGLESALD